MQRERTVLLIISGDARLKHSRNFFDEMYLNTPWEQHYNNLDGRTILDRLASVKYFVVKKGKESDLPYGYSRLSGEAEK